MTANPCTNCGSTNLSPKWNSTTNEGWVHCDGCGKTSPAVNIDKGRDQVIRAWNEANARQ